MALASTLCGPQGGLASLLRTDWLYTSSWSCRTGKRKWGHLLRADGERDAHQRVDRRRVVWIGLQSNEIQLTVPQSELKDGLQSWRPPNHYGDFQDLLHCHFALPAQRQLFGLQRDTASRISDTPFCQPVWRLDPARIKSNAQTLARSQIVGASTSTSPLYGASLAAFRLSSPSVLDQPSSIITLRKEKKKFNKSWTNL